ncbi:MAG: START domain-containing protein [Bacteroidales bacterium]|nr:hypothetical protein [Bacteroidales bacterium]MBS3777000.1 hypothetical protein [Bacteroidales bacterium]
MKLYITAIFFIALMMNASAAGDDWELRKDRDGIRVYTKEREGSGIYMYKVITSSRMKPERVYKQVVDFRENLKYMELVDSLAILDHRKNERYINYMWIDMPWPVKNREMVMDMKVQFSPDSIRLVSDDLPGRIQDSETTIKVADFHEEWIIRAFGNTGNTQITVTGWINPGGSIPTWVVNMFSVRTPFRFISGILKELRAEATEPGA